MTDIERVFNNEWHNLSALLAALFVFREVGETESLQAQMVIDGNGVDWVWLQMIANAVDPKEAAKAAAAEFCKWWMEENNNGNDND
jgi:hypothetical protein